MRQRRRLAGGTPPPWRAPDSGRPGPGLPAECSGWLVCGHVQDASQPRRRPDPQRRYLLQMHRGSVTRCRCRRPLSLGANQDRSLVSAISRPWAGTSIEFCRCPEWSACHSACHSICHYSASLERTGWTTGPTRAARTAPASTPVDGWPLSCKQQVGGSSPGAGSCSVPNRGWMRHCRGDQDRWPTRRSAGRRSDRRGLGRGRRQ